MATAIALAHDTFDGALLLGVCDKIVPGLLIGALSFGHLPALLVPAGPMPSGLPNAEKSRVRQRHAEGRAGREELLAAEQAAYHAPGTCTFYGTANSNQLLVEAMGAQLPGAGFVNPGTELRAALTAAAGERVAAITALGDEYTPLGEVVDERALVNAIVALLATGGSTNHTMHLVAIAAAAGIRLEWEDFASLSRHVPLLARIYPNGEADVNHFHAAGGTALLFAELLEAGLMHADVSTVAGPGLERYTRRPGLGADGELEYAPVARRSGDPLVLRQRREPFAPEGGLRLLDGNLGRAVVKVSAVAREHRAVTAPARVFEDQARAARRLRAGRARGRPRRRRPQPGPARQRDAGAAQADAGARRPARPRRAGGAGHRRAHVGRLGQGAGGDPLHAGGGGGRAAGAAARRRPGRARLRRRPARRARRRPRGARRRGAAGRRSRQRPPTGFGRELFACLRGSVGPADAGASVFPPPEALAAASPVRQPSRRPPGRSGDGRRAAPARAGDPDRDDRRRRRSGAARARAARGRGRRAGGDAAHPGGAGGDRGDRRRGAGAGARRRHRPRAGAGRGGAGGRRRLPGHAGDDARAARGARRRRRAGALRLRHGERGDGAARARLRGAEAVPGRAARRPRAGAGAGRPAARGGLLPDRRDRPPAGRPTTWRSPTSPRSAAAG